MNIKSIVAALALTVGATTGALATATWNYNGAATASRANLFGNESASFGFSLTGITTGSSLVVTSKDLYSVTLDGVSFVKTAGNNLDSWSFAGTSLTAGAHELVVTLAATGRGAYNASLFFSPGTLDTASLVATPVPEPETLALMLAGLGALGISARRRRQA